jgi:hypothetical protein
VINAFANYFKHRDERASSWAKLTGNSKKTADVITAAGAKQGSSGNLRQALETLGIDYKDPTKLLTEVIAWEQAIASIYKRELGSLKLL